MTTQPYHISLIIKLIVMKKLLVLLIVGSVSLASCSKDEIVDDLNHKEVKAEHLEGHTWKVKHIKIHEANLDGENLNAAQRTTLEGLIKMGEEKIKLQKDDKLVFKYGDTDYNGKWTPKTENNQWLVEFNANPTPPFGLEGKLEIRNGRLYLSLGGLDYTIKEKHYVIGKIEFELIKN